MKEEKQQLGIILLIVFIGFIGTSIAYPVFPPLFLHPEQGSIVPSSWHESMRSIFLGIALAVYPLGQFIGSPILGGCSDRYGRKLMLVISLIGSSIGYFLTALSLEFNGLWGLLISRFLTGLMEGNIAIVRAMAIDLGSINKFKSLGRISSASLIGYIVGPLLGGFLSDKHLVSWFSFAFPFFLGLIFSIVALLLSIFKLKEKNYSRSREASIGERFNLIGRFKLLFKSSKTLKYLLIISTIFTFSMDIFYEFGPVYLTELWAMTPAGIAIYNALLCITLAIGNGWLPHYLSNYFSVKRITIMSMIVTAIILGLMAVFPSLLGSFLLFGLIGLSIGVVFINLTVQISDAADKLVQGEAMGTQHSLRVLGDAVICFAGGFLIVVSVIVPIALSSMVALIAVGVYIRKFKKSN
jgi:MFS transporter, DHA1 family, tetracycline resistance protein